jgi:hypothetical protein
MSQSNTTPQWDRLLLNLGIWEGSFTRLQVDGVVREDVRSTVTLTGIDNNQTMRQTIEYFNEDGTRSQNKILEYSSLNRSTLFFEDGAFSQGSLQFAPFSEFGAELGFITGDRRLRLVQLFDKNSQLSSLTLIREHRQGTSPNSRPPLTVAALLGTWEGEAVTLYPDWRTPDRYSTRLSIRQEGDRLHQTLAMPAMEIASSAAIDGSRLLFDQGAYPIQVLLLPDGASSNTPLTIPRGTPFLLEAGWLVEPDLRYRMIRSYDAQGGWSSLTLVTERRVN